MKRWIKYVLGVSLPTLAVIGAMTMTAPEYDRSAFQLWVDADRDCQDTRQEVLIRDADGEIQMSVDGCRVVWGKWEDPYSGETFTDPRDLDIDHLVPLKNAWESGAHKWDDARRKEYANYLGNDYHLIAVKASENRKKGAKAPDGYMPPNEEFQCEYIALWVAVKDEWELFVTGSELETLTEYQERCL